MTEPCGITHPDHPEVACNIREALADHEEHLGYKQGEGVIEWPNPDFQPKVRITPRGRRPAAEVAAEINRETIQARAALQDRVNELRSGVSGSLRANLGVDTRMNTRGQINREAYDPEAIAIYEAMPRVGSQRFRVLEAIALSPDGLTHAEIREVLDLNPNSVRPRRQELELGGWIYAAEATRISPSGQPSVVWVLTDKGRREWTGPKEI